MNQYQNTSKRSSKRREKTLLRKQEELMGDCHTATENPTTGERSSEPSGSPDVPVTTYGNITRSNVPYWTSSAAPGGQGWSLSDLGGASSASTLTPSTATWQSMLWTDVSIPPDTVYFLNRDLILYYPDRSCIITNIGVEEQEPIDPDLLVDEGL